jgi:ParB-like nuclease domain
VSSSSYADSRTDTGARGESRGGPRFRGGGDLHTVPVSSLTAGYSPRLNGEDAQHVRLLAQAEASWPPILVQRVTMRVIDGMHRLRAAQLLGHATIDVRFFDGTEAEVLVAAVKANTGHGLPLTLADREAAASRVIALLPRQSDRWIAEATGLAPGTVAALRRRSSAGSASSATSAGDVASGTRVGRDGRERPVDIADRRRMAEDAILQHPDASLRMIARMVGLSPGTVRDVRQRVSRGEDPVVRARSVGGRQKPPGPAVHPLPAGRHGRDTVVGQVKDRTALLRNLSRDPSLRFTERGRTLLEWLAARAAGPSGLDALVDAVPEHSVYVVACLARMCADEWLEAARRLENRLEST